MRIYAVADIHAKQYRLDLIRENIDRHAPDVLIAAGDIANYFNPLPVFHELNNLPVPVLAVRGNTDPRSANRILKDGSNLYNLHLNPMTVNHIRFVGIGGTIPVPFKSRLCLLENRLIKRLKACLTPETVLVAHPPPRGILDMVLGRFSAGSNAVFSILQDQPPRLFICGHIHETPGVVSYNGTAVINCTMGKKSAGALIEYDGHSKPDIEML
jgi:Icc-related predicted phosphoesterase